MWGINQCIIKDHLTFGMSTKETTIFDPRKRILTYITLTANVYYSYLKNSILKEKRQSQNFNTTIGGMGVKVLLHIEKTWKIVLK